MCNILSKRIFAFSKIVDISEVRKKSTVRIMEHAGRACFFRHSPPCQQATHLHWTEKDRIKINLHSRECVLQRLKRLHRAAILADTPEDFTTSFRIKRGLNAWNIHTYFRKYAKVRSTAPRFSVINCFPIFPTSVRSSSSCSHSMRISAISCGVCAIFAAPLSSNKDAS